MPTMHYVNTRMEMIEKRFPELWTALEPIFTAARRGVEADQTIAIWQVEIRDRNETIASLKAELAAFKEGLPATEDQNARFAIEGCIEYGRQGVNPPPDDHWLAPFWNMGRQLSDLAALKVECDEAVRREREAISKMAADLEEGQSVTTKLVLRLLTDRIRARKGEHDEQR